MTIRKSIHVKHDHNAAFRLFTAGIGSWWPLGEGLSFGGDRAREIFIEGWVGGRFFERFSDGEEFVVGKVTAYEPPARVAFTWRQPDWETDTEVEVRSAPEARGTRVTLEHRGWEALGAGGGKPRGNYDGGWDLALSRYAA